MIDRTGPSESSLFMLLHNIPAVVIMLGFMTFGVWHERDSGKGGGAENVGDILKRELKMGDARPHFVYQTVVPSQIRDFLIKCLAIKCL